MIESSNDRKDIAKLLGGNGLPQILFLITLPILAGMFNKEAFGIFATFSALIAFAQPISMLTLENALLTTEKDKLEFTFFVSVLMLLLFSAATCILFYFIIQFNLIPQIALNGKYLIAILVGVLIFGASRLSVVLANRHAANKFIAKSALLAGLIRVFFPLLAGFIYGSEPIFLIFGSIFGELIIILVLNRFTRALFLATLEYFQSFDLKKIILTLVRNKNFVMQGSLATFLINSSAFIPAIGIGYFWGPEAVGIYFMADRIIGLPAQFMSGALNSFFISAYSQKIREGIKGTGAILKSIKFGLGLSIPFMIGVFFAGSWIEYLLGEEWTEVTNILNFMLLVALSKIIVMPIATIPFILKKQNYELVGGLIRAILLCLAFVLAIKLQLTVNEGLQLICLSIAASYWCFFMIYLWLDSQYSKSLK